MCRGDLCMSKKYKTLGASAVRGGASVGVNSGNNNNLSECIHVAVVGHHLMPV